MKKFNTDKTGKIKYVNAILRFFMRIKKPDGIIDICNSKEILVICFDSIGDVVMLIPFLRILKKNAPDAKITLACRWYAEEVLREQRLVDRFFICSNRLLASKKYLIRDGFSALGALLRINKRKYDIALEPRGDFRDIFFMHFCRSVRKVSYTYTGGEYMLTDPIIPDESVIHLIDDKMVFLRRIGCDFSEEDIIPRIELTKGQIEDNCNFADIKKLNGRYVIGIHPGASKEIKKWKKFPELLLKLKDIPDSFFLFFSATGDDVDVKPLIDCCKDNGIDYLHICGSISDYIKRMALCDMVVCNDSSAAHFASALGIEVHVMFGPVLSEFAKPYSNAGVHVYEKNHVGCRPCNQGECLYGNRCLEEISVDEVAEGIFRSIPEG